MHVNNAFSLSHVSLYRCFETKQCVDHALCAPPTGTGVCVCEPWFYAEDGKCYKRKFVGERCNDGQCVGRATCTGDIGGQCRCEAGYFQDGRLCAGSELRYVLNIAEWGFFLCERRAV